MLLQLVLKANELRFLTLHMFIDGHALYCLERALKDCELIAKPAMATFPSLFCRLYCAEWCVFVYPSILSGTFTASYFKGLQSFCFGGNHL